jgi:hypothetical protein
MLIICDGMPRSASTWTYNVVLALLRGLHPLAELHSGYDEDISHFLESGRSTATHSVVKCHELDPRGRAMVESGQAKAIYTWRDPADAVVSCMHMFGYDFESALAVIGSSLELHRFHRTTGSALIVAYEQIVTATNETVTTIATYLGLHDDPEMIRTIALESSLERVKESVDSLAGSDRFVRDAGLEYDPETLLHRSHIRNGGFGYGREALTAQQVGRIDALLKEWGLTQPAVT